MAFGVVLLPLGLLGLGMVGVRLGIWVAGALVAAPSYLILLYVGGRLGWSGASLLVAAAVGAVGIAALYVRYRSVQDLARYLAIVPIAVLVYFFVILPPAVLAGDGTGQEAAVGEVANPVPVVVVVLDELPLASLIDSTGALLYQRFPAFARLAADGVWYRNAITVETRTTESIPAILSGVRVPDDLVPNAVHHPRTLMTMLAESHAVGAIEPVTDLCPARICPDDPGEGGRWTTLVSDLAVVYGHLVVPSPWSDRLPPIDENWTGFVTGPDSGSWDLIEAVGEAVEADRRGDVGRFLDSLEEEADRPLLRVAHLVLPHRPWEFLPDGSRHGQESPQGYGGRSWGSDGFFMAEGWRRHMLQVGYTDSVLGEVIDRLEEAGSYETSLLVVVADHGVHFQTDVEDMRVTNRDSLGSILPIPLFVKYPSGLDDAPPPGTIDDRRVETIDVVPTVLDVLGAVHELDLDGRSLLTEFTRTGSELDLRGESFPVGANGDEKLQVAARREAWFPGGDLWSLVPEPSLHHLLGAPLPPSEVPPTELELVEDEPAPPLIEGAITFEETPSGDELAVLTGGDGRVIAVTKPYEIDARTARFSFLVDPEGEYEAPFSAVLLAGGAGSG